MYFYSFPASLKVRHSILVESRISLRESALGIPLLLWRQVCPQHADAIIALLGFSKVFSLKQSVSLFRPIPSKVNHPCKLAWSVWFSHCTLSIESSSIWLPSKLFTTIGMTNPHWAFFWYQVLQLSAVCVKPGHFAGCLKNQLPLCASTSRGVEWLTK